MPLTFPASPTNNQTATLSGTTYTYNATKGVWEATASGGGFVAGSFSENILPDTDNTYDIGSASYKIRDLYVSDNSLHIGDHTMSADSEGINLPALKIGTGSNRVKLTANAEGELRQVRTVGGVAQSEEGIGSSAFSTIGTYDNNIYGISPTGYAANASNTSGTSLTTGHSNFMNGPQAGENITSGIRNILFGPEAGSSISTSHNNFFAGYHAGRLSQGSNGVAIGLGALKSAVTGDHNVAIGNSAMRYAGDTPTANVAVGYNALGGQTSIVMTGNDNVGIGTGTGSRVTTGEQNTFLGYYAGTNIFASTGSTSTGSGNTIIGKFSHAPSATTSNSFTLGGSAITNLRCNDTSISSLSDERDKTNIQDTTLGLDFIKDVRPVDFTWDRRDGTMGSMKDVGFIAQELWDTELKHSSAHRTRMVQFDNPDKLEAAPNRMFPVLVKAVQELAAKNEELEARLAVLEGN
mgnify:CR=1 FL=1